MRRLIVLILVLSSLFSLFTTINSLSYVISCHIVDLPPGYFECIYQYVNNGLYVVYYSTAPVYFAVQTVSGYTAFSTQGTSYYGYISLPEGEYKVLFVNNMTDSNVTIQVYLGDGRPYPTGIADYGIDASNGVARPYVEKFNGVVGVAQVYSISAYNASINSYGASLQLNTVLQVNTVQGSQEYWLQNVVQFSTNTSQYRVVDNVWNYTSYPSVLNSSAITGEGTVASTLEGTHLNYYYVYSTNWFNTTYPLYTALLIKVATVPQGVRVVFSYLNGTSFTDYDNVTIKVGGVTSAYLLVDGYNTTGSGNAYDTELVFGGECNGEITQFDQINATIYMFYLNNTGVLTPKSLSPFGLDTAEASDNLFTVPYQGAYNVEVGNGNELVIANKSFPFDVGLVNGSKVIDLGQRADVELDVRGGVPPYLVEIGNETFIDLFVGNTYYSFLPNGTGDLTYPITVEDLYGNTKSLDYSLRVNPDPTVSLSVPRNDTDVGLPITLTPNVRGGTPPYNETWYVNGVQVPANGAFNFSSPGTYNLTLKVVDSVGYAVEKSVTVEVYKDPSLTVSTNQTVTDQGVPIGLNITGYYGVPPYTVKVYVNGTLENASVTQTGVRVPLDLAPGVYSVEVKLTDSAGYQVDKTVILRFNQDPTLAVNEVAQGSFFVTATSVTISGGAYQGTPPYTYTVYVNGNKYYNGNDLSLSVPLSLGKNNITVVVKDSSGVSITRTILVYSGYDWADIAALIAVVIIASLVLIFLKKRRR
ncbi:thermopsin family protease [Stygiolobus caldivivus]|nr:thermopsin family protease [Stygiolobus caldivivus]